MNGLTAKFHETTINLLADYARQYIEDNWQQVWERHSPELEKIYERGGDSAYGFFCLKLFQPLGEEFADAGFASRPVLPGTFPQSEEHWGPWEDRERRFWSVISLANGRELGALVTRVYHDHTRLRLPRPPQVYAVGETDPHLISQAIRIAIPVREGSTAGGGGNDE
ncbi:hypothetical protein J19TS2_37780 [Cohnella xylanilytica]|uniref:Uncharacterized protein n=1 Tax=Cohnella xylanilytica TaxID=557555 RepID=A0A841TY23_9BACL|nr:DUF6022 family protein [Cohnella xylanilytica]MBB6690544.1 hypothetical protein [Cohnella xylanilytica]GIO14223.1 hypothetical protein J19TS2_37780 [Cohnella xylanilytica]